MIYRTLKNFAIWCKNCVKTNYNWLMVSAEQSLLEKIEF